MEENLLITFDEVLSNPEIQVYVRKSDESLRELSYTDHSEYHTRKTSAYAREILSVLGYCTRDIELVQIAGYMHDIGNLVNRIDHAQIGALMAFVFLREMGASPNEICEIISAIGNHDVDSGSPVSAIASALIIADKCDINRERVVVNQKNKMDIHNRINFSVFESELSVAKESRTILFKMKMDTSQCTVMEYLNVFSPSIHMCQQAAEFLKAHFSLEINETKFF